MASKIIGRADCPECGFHGAHVKESDKCLYRYCPECGSQYHARTERQAAGLRAKMRPTVGEGAPAPTATATATPTGPAPARATPDPAPTAPSTPTAPPAPAAPKRRGLFA